MEPARSGSPRPPGRVRQAAAAGMHSWFALTAAEQQALIVVLSLFLLGLGAMAWHRRDADTGRTNGTATMNVKERDSK